MNVSTWSADLNLIEREIVTVQTGNVINGYCSILPIAKTVAVAAAAAAVRINLAIRSNLPVVQMQTFHQSPIVDSVCPFEVGVFKMTHYS